MFVVARETAQVQEIYFCVDFWKRETPRCFKQFLFDPVPTQGSVIDSVINDALGVLELSYLISWRHLHLRLSCYPIRVRFLILPHHPWYSPFMHAWGEEADPNPSPPPKKGGGRRKTHTHPWMSVNPANRGLLFFSLLFPSPYPWSAATTIPELGMHQPWYRGLCLVFETPRAPRHFLLEEWRAPYEEIVNFYQEHFKGTKAMDRGMEAIAFVASLKYQQS